LFFLPLVASIKMAAILSSVSSLTEDLSKLLKADGKDVVEMIMEEHRLVEALGDRYVLETNQKEKQGIAHNIIKLLSIHAVCEEAALYPWMKKHLHNGESVVAHALREHQDIKNDLYALDQMKLGDAGYDAKVMKALKDTKHHVIQGESELLPAFRRQASKTDLDEIRNSFLNAKMMAPSRPHPSAPTEPPQNKIAAAATMPVDAVRDAGRFS